MVAEHQSKKNFGITLRVWRQAGPKEPGRFVDYQSKDLNPDMSFLEMLDVVNDELTTKGEEPIAFDSDCREGICGTCGLMIDGRAHGPLPGTTTCQLHMRRFKDGDTIVVEPFRARAFPLIKDLMVDRTALDRMSRALDEFIIRGIKTTIPLHKIIMKDPNFRRGRYSTAFIERLMASTQPIVDEKAKDQAAQAA